MVKVRLNIKVVWSTALRVAMAAVVLCLSACSSQPEKMPEKQFVKKHLEETIAEQKKSFELPPAVRDAMMRGGGNRTLSAEESERFDVSVVGMPAQTFFLSLVADAGVNVVVDPQIAGSITLELKQVTVADVLRITRDVFGYEFKYENGIYTILPRVMRTEVFPINYLDVERKGETVTSVVIGEIESTNGGNNNSRNNSNRNNSSRSNSDGENDTGMLSGAGVTTKHETDFWKSLETALKAIVGTVEGATIVVNSQAGLVLVKALPRELKAVRKFLEKSELSVKRQVILETKILEVSLNDDYKTGVNWNEIQGQLSYDYGWAQTTANATKNFASVFNVVDISQFLSLLETQGMVQVLSSPRVSTVNNQKAIIRVGVDEFFVTGIRSNTTASAITASTSPEVDLTSFFSGISLDVTPQIADNGDVILHIHPIVSEIKDQQKSFTVDSKNFSLPMALRDVRESDSIVRAKSGQVVVLGGLMKETSTQVNGKRPFLSEIPGLNLLFKTKSDVKTKSELVILMRPIVADDSAWSSMLEESAQRMNPM